jgi:hypothetical protein
MTTFLIIAAIAAVGIYILTKKKQPKVETVSTIENVEEQPETSPEVQKVEETVAKVAESTAQMEERLKNLANPDSEKPFAKISTPEIAETPAEAPTAAPKKRSYKKRAPKKKDETNS